MLRGCFLVGNGEFAQEYKKLKSLTMCNPSLQMPVQNSKLFLILPQEIKYPALDRLLFELAKISGDHASILFYFSLESYVFYYYYYSCFSRFISYM